MRLVKKFFVLLIFFLIFLTQGVILASESNLPKTTVNPDNYLIYPIKRLIEKAIILTKLSQQAKTDYYKYLVLTRLAELKYVVENKMIGEVQTSTQRLSYQIGILTDYINLNGVLTKNKRTENEFLSKYKTMLENLRDQYPANSSYWMLVQHSINSIDINLEKLK